MQITRVADDVWLFVGEAYGANAAALVAGREVLLVDALGSRADGQALSDWLQARALAVRWIVSTHYFSDHMGGLALFPGAQILAHRNHAHTFTSEEFRSAAEAGHFVAPTVILDGTLRIRWGRCHLEVFPNPGHTLGTLNVDVPEADLLFVGDTAVGNMAYLRYSTPGLLADALDRAARRGRRRIVEGHGTVRGPECLAHARHYLEALGTRARAARAQGPEAVRAIPLRACLPPGILPTPFEETFHRRNLESILTRDLYAEVA